MKYIHLTQEELAYMHEAINEWHAGALQYIEKMKNYKYDADDDSYDPMPPGKCIMLTEAQIINVKAWTKTLDTTWEKNNGEIELNFFCTQILKHSVHKNMQSPHIVSIKQKVDSAVEAKEEQSGALQKQSLFAGSQEASEQKVNATRMTLRSHTNRSGALAFK